MAAPALRVVEDPEAAEILLHPLRSKLLGLLSEPNSASGVSEKAGVPRQHANYHLRELERVGLAELVQENRRGSAVERILRASAGSYVIGAKALGDLAGTPDKVRDRFSLEYLIALAERMVDELAALLKDPAAFGGRVPSLSVETKLQFHSFEERAAFARELTNEVARIVAKYHREEGEASETYRLLLAAHPVPEGSK